MASLSLGSSSKLHLRRNLQSFSTLLGGVRNIKKKLSDSNNSVFSPLSPLAALPALLSGIAISIVALVRPSESFVSKFGYPY